MAVSGLWALTVYVAVRDAGDTLAESWGPGGSSVKSTLEMEAFPCQSLKITCVIAIVFIFIS